MTIIIETSGGKRIAVVDTIEDGREEDVDYLIVRSKVDYLYDYVIARGGKVNRGMISDLIANGWLLSPPSY
jgi:hypothetical protein